jgi:hypothetical protein
MMDRSRFERAESLPEFVARAVENHDLWVSTLKRASLTPEHAARAAALPGTWHVVVLLEDWCGDAVNSVPFLHALAEATPGVRLRVLERDRNLDLMDAHLSNGARAIPLAIVYDATFVERGQWGSRPAVLQQWVREHGLAMEKDARYKQVRTWYARDKGVTTVEEVLTLLERAAADAAARALEHPSAQVAGSSA